MPLPKDVKFVTFDCYGTLIDWETGVYDAFQKEADRDGFTIDRDVLIPRFIEIQREIQRGSYELYAEVLRRTAVRVAARAGLGPRALAVELPARQRAALAAVPRDQRPARALRQEVRDRAILSNIDDKLLGATRRHFRVDFDLVVTAQQVRTYKPDPAHFKECARRIERQEELGPHRRRATPTDVEPCLKAEDPGDLGQPARRGARVRPEEARPPRSRPSATRQAAQAPPSAGRARRLGQPDALVVTSRFWQTNAIALRAGEEAMLIDSPYFPDELEVLPELLARPGFEPDGLLATHADFDHLLGRLAFPGLALGRGGDAPSSACTREPGAAQRELRDYDDELLRRARRRRWRSARSRRCRCPASSSSASRSSSCTRPRATRPTAWRSGRRGRGVLVCGDYLSDVEIPCSAGGSLDDYRATLARLAPLVEAADDRGARARLRARPRRRRCESSTRTVDYLDALAAGERAAAGRPRHQAAEGASTRRTWSAPRPRAAASASCQERKPCTRTTLPS